MEKTSKRLELTDLLGELFKKTPNEIVAKVVYLIQGKLRPDFEGIEIGVAEKLVIRAVYRSTAIETKRIEDAYRIDGDLGQAVSKLIEQKTQKTLFDETKDEHVGRNFMVPEQITMFASMYRLFVGSTSNACRVMLDAFITTVVLFSCHSKEPGAAVTCTCGTTSEAEVSAVLPA